MMELQWTGKALSDLVRLYDFLAPVNRPPPASCNHWRPHRPVSRSIHASEKN
jgi:hypothetical protein